MSETREMDIDSAPTTKQGLPITKSIEGYVVIASNIHEEATEEDVTDFFLDYGDVKNLHLNLDRQTGYVKGYAFVEFSKLEEARRAVNDADGEELLGNILSVDYAFVDVPVGASADMEKDDDNERRRDRSPERGILDD